MKIYECKLFNYENIYYCSRQLDNEYRSIGLISNTSLPYALKFVLNDDIPKVISQHKIDFQILNDNAIYITPGKFIGEVKYQIERFNTKPERIDNIWYEEKDKQSRLENYPDEGWINSIDRNQTCIFYIIVDKNIEINIPQYIRLGKERSKCKIEYKEVEFEIVEGLLYSDLYLRCEDVDPENIKILHPKIISIQHSTILYNLNFIGKGIKIKSEYFNSPIIPYNSKFYIAIS